jgi:hypothetical protein
MCVGFSLLGANSLMPWDGSVAAKHSGSPAAGTTFSLLPPPIADTGSLFADRLGPWRRLHGNGSLSRQRGAAPIVPVSLCSGSKTYREAGAQKSRPAQCGGQAGRLPGGLPVSREPEIAAKVPASSARPWADELSESAATAAKLPWNLNCLGTFLLNRVSRRHG